MNAWHTTNNEIHLNNVHFICSHIHIRLYVYQLLFARSHSSLTTLDQLLAHESFCLGFSVCACAFFFSHHLWECRRSLRYYALNMKSISSLFAVCSHFAFGVRSLAPMHSNIDHYLIQIPTWLALYNGEHRENCTKCMSTVINEGLFPLLCTVTHSKDTNIVFILNKNLIIIWVLFIVQIVHSFEERDFSCPFSHAIRFRQSARLRRISTSK